MSKLHTVRDGLRILAVIVSLMKAVRPFQFFTILSAATFLLALSLAVPLIVTYVETGLVPRVPTAVLVTGLSIVSLLMLQPADANERHHSRDRESRPA